MFRRSIEHVQPFYGYADLKDIALRHMNLDRSIDLLVELPGVFWLTYFGPAYVHAIGEGRLQQIRGFSRCIDGGALLRLAATPDGAPMEARSEAEQILGAERFIDRTGLATKRRGQYALTYEQLRQQ